jgi:exosortase/archaeosortase family protein
LWYIPLGLVLVYLFNIFRISSIAAVIEQHPDWFKFTHEYFFKYLFYGLIFGMWVLWEEKISLRKGDEAKAEVKAKAQAKVEAQA